MEDSTATVPAWLAVVLPIATLLIGAAVPIVTHRLQTAEDRKARQEAREDARRDRQRVAVLDLQDALTETQDRFAAVAYDRLEGRPAPPNSELLRLRGRVEALLPRVEDTEAKSLGQTFVDRAMALTGAQDAQQLEPLVRDVVAVRKAFHERVGQILHTLETGSG